MAKSLRNNRRGGFTLVELLAAFGILILIVALAAGIILSSMNAYARSARLDAAKQLCAMVFGFYESRLAVASVVSIGEECGDMRLSVLDGRIMFKNGVGLELLELYPDDVYAGAKVRVITEAENGGLSLKVEIYDGDGVIYFRQSAFALYTLSRLGGEVGGAVSESVDADIYFAN